MRRSGRTMMARGIPARAAHHVRRHLISARRLARRPLSALISAGGAVAVVAVAVPVSAGAARSPAPPLPVLQGPSARYGASMDYDAATGSIVLFGGVKPGGVLGDTWAFNGSAWTRLSPPASPPALGFGMMA